MSGYAIFVYKGELHVAHGLDAAQHLVQRMSQAVATGEATGVAVKAVDGAMPIVQAYNDASFWTDVSNSLQTADYNALTRDTLAGMFGIIGGTLALPAGPSTAVATDVLLSEIYKKSYDAVTLGSRDVVAKMLDFLDGGTPFDGINDISYDINGNVISGLITKGQDPSEVIESLQTIFTQAEKTRSPLILDLDGLNGVETLSKTAGIHFDHDGNKFAEQTGWVGKNDGMLVWDRNGNGQIDNGTELFGNNTVLKNGSKADNGFTALADLDFNKDGKVDANDAASSQLRVFKDANSNGVVDAGELLTLAEAGVKSLNTGYTTQAVTDASGNQHLQAGSFTTTAGQSRAMDDVWFAVDTALTIDKDLVAVNSTIAALPRLAGFSNVHNRKSEAANERQWSLVA